MKILENTDIAKNSDDWNTIACGPEPNQGIIIPIPQDHIQDIPLPLTGKSLLIGPEELLKLKERSFRRKRALIEARASKINGNKLKPHLNLMETNSKKSRSLKKTGIKMTLASQENRSLKKIEKLIAENQALKAEISNLQAKISNTITLRQIGNIATQNRFDLLDNDISPQTDSSLTMDCQPLEDIASYLTKKNSQRTSISSEVKRNEKKHNSNVAVKHNDFSNKNVRDNEPNNNSGKKIRTEKPPPINILDQDVKDTTKLLKTKLTDKNCFYIRNINSGKHALYVNTLANYNIAIDLLRTCNSKFYTYTAKSHKPLNLLLKGLDHNYSEQEVLEELKSQNIHNVKLIKVVRFSTSKSKQDDIILPMFIIQVTPDNDINNLSKVKYLFHQVISWNRLVKRDIIQCKRCQRIGHAAANCNLPYRCVKCDVKHEPGRCSSPTGTQLSKTQLFCINCNKYGHPASYRGCPTIIESKKKYLWLII